MARLCSRLQEFRVQCFHLWIQFPGPQGAESQLRNKTVKPEHAFFSMPFKELWVTLLWGLRGLENGCFGTKCTMDPWRDYEATNNSKSALNRSHSLGRSRANSCTNKPMPKVASRIQNIPSQSSNWEPPNPQPFLISPRPDPKS